MGEDVLSTICNDVHDAKYFSICVDSIPDVSHIDHLTIIVRYINQNGSTVERSLKFIPIHSHSGESLKENVIKTLHEMTLSLNNCRGQSYDNAPNMSGKHTGLHD